MEDDEEWIEVVDKDFTHSNSNKSDKESNGSQAAALKVTPTLHTTSDPLDDEAWLEAAFEADELEEKYEIAPTWMPGNSAPKGTGLSAAIAMAKQTPPEHELMLPHPTASNESSNDQFRPGNTISETLRNFGLHSFRNGQEDIVNATLAGRDSAVFWATGLGKSLCYQLPALHSGRTAFIISPLISLMQDQCIKLNNLCRRDVATFLGSGQADHSAEMRALSGQYLLVYCTPEKATSSGFLDQLSSLHASRGLSLIAVDEAHCVSEWGHDFRPSFRQLHTIREHIGLKKVPVMALTATAVPRVQTDICEQLCLQSPQIVKSSFDRPNLHLAIYRKPLGGTVVAFQKLVTEMNRKPTDNSTIIYAPTQKDVEKITSLLSAQLNNICLVMAYHAGLPSEKREEAHRAYLTGRCQIVVATVAFGMGIDKPDTRRVIHFGSPKTIEEYYQQVGRAGRDGLPGECYMYADLHDFGRYKDDFYLGSLNPIAKKAVLNSLESLQSMSMSETDCRRKLLLQFFEEVPQFGDHCNNCDNCEKVKKYSGDFQRDYSPSARVVCQALMHLKPCAISVLEKVINDKIVEEWRFINKTEYGIAHAKSEINKAKLAQGANNVPISDLCRNLLPSLVTADYVKQIHQTPKGSSRGFSAYCLTPKGRNLIANPSCKCLLPVPECIRTAERDAEEKRLKTINTLTNAGIDISNIPDTEISQGTGEILNAYTHFFNKIEQTRKYDAKKADAMLKLKDTILEWRAITAEKLLMSPASVLAEHLVFAIAYASTQGPLSEMQLREIGVRVRGTDDLSARIASWCTDNNIQSESQQQQNGNNSGNMIELPSKFQMPPWELAVYLPDKPWEYSAIKFANGESLAAIAVQQGVTKAGIPKKAILPSTVGGHLLQALPYGRHCIDLDRLAVEFHPPMLSEWNILSKLERENGIDVTTAFTINRADFLASVYPAVKIPFNERSDPQKFAVTRAFRNLDWYISLRRCSYEPKFYKPEDSNSSSSIPSTSIKREAEEVSNGDTKRTRC